MATPRSSQDSRDRLAKHDTEAEVRVGWKMAGLAFTASSEVLAGAGLGYLADRWGWTSPPTGVSVGAILGIVVAMWSLIKGALKLNKQLDQMHPIRGRGKALLDVSDEDEQAAEDEDEPRS